MRTSEILDELPRLSKDDREVIRLRLAELDGDGWADDDDPLSEADKAVIKSRIEAHERAPETAIPWEQFGDSVLHTARHERAWQKRVSNQGD
jgi:putative addiction module component (TIGR02574 family)